MRDLHSLLVLKLGGKVLEDSPTLNEIATEIAQMETPVIVIHGGGNEVNRWSKALDLPVLTYEGLRITDDATLDLVVAVLAGLVNKRTVAILRAAGLDAVGLSALDGGICQVSRSPQADHLGHVGVIEGVRLSLLESLLESGATPVVASIGAQDSALLNINADDVAASVAAALPNTSLVFLSDVPGVVLDGKAAPRFSMAEVDDLLETSSVTHGMRAKLRAIRYALQSSVKEAHLGCWSGSRTLTDMLSGDSRATRFYSMEESLPPVRTGGESRHG